MSEKLDEIRKQAATAFQNAGTTRELYEMKVQYLGKQGSFSAIMKEMGKLPPDQKPVFGKLVNEAKQELETVYSKREEQLKNQELQAKLQSEAIDLTLPAFAEPLGSQHPIAIVIEEISRILARLGYAVRTGPL